MRTAAERSKLIESYGNAYNELMDGLKKYPKEMWGFKPSEGWSIHEILCHIADSEANSYVRCRRFIAEPGSGVYGYDTDKWSAALNYTGQDVNEMIDLFRSLRRNSYLVIRNLPETVWANTVDHSESGAMTFDRWLDIYEAHVRDHLKQIDEVYREWQKKRA
jgi:DinB family protein